MKTEVASIKDIKAALKSHAIPAKVETPDFSKDLVDLPIKPVIKKQTKKRKVVAVVPPCQYCKKTGFKRTNSQKFHEVECILNPKREVHLVHPCCKCGVEITTRAIKNHEEACDGIAAHTLKRIEISEDLLRRKAIALRDGVPFVSKRGLTTNVSKVEIPRLQEILDTTGIMVGLDGIMQIMEERVAESNVTMKQFSEWSQLTRQLWKLSS